MEKTNYLKFYNKYKYKYYITRNIKIFFDETKGDKPYRVKIEKTLSSNKSESMKIEHVDAEALYVKISLNSLNNDTASFKSLKHLTTVA